MIKMPPALRGSVARLAAGIGVTSSIGAALISAGCGSGGGLPANVTLKGQVLGNPNVQSLGVYSARLNNNPSPTATTDANGAYTLVVPRTSLTGHDTISVFDSSGALVAQAPVPTGASGMSNVTLPATMTGPPAPPPASTI